MKSICSASAWVGLSWHRRRSSSKAKILAHILIEIGGLLDKRCVTRGHDWKPGLERQYIGTLVPYAKVDRQHIHKSIAKFTPIIREDFGRL
uniref:Uncharacterized protein n=1 Tax=Physcomitrium patens TaxID=3218 RepID=A0A7I4DRS9_PHYPA